MLKYIFIFFLLNSLVPLIESNPILSGLQRDENLAEYAKVALYMVQNFISPKTNTLIIMEKCEYFCHEQEKYHTTILQYFLRSLNDTLSIQLFFGQPDDRPWDYNLFIVNSWSAFEALRFRIPVTKHEREYYFFVLLTFSSKYLRYRNLSKIFDLCISFNVRNVVVMNRATNDDYIGFYTYEIFRHNNCHRILSVREINRYANGKLQTQLLFPPRLLNFYGCSLTVSAHIIEPLLSFKGNLDNPNHLMDMDRLSGIEGEILKLIAKTLNFKINLRFSKEMNKINLIADSTGNFRDLEQKTAHIAIGGLSSTMENAIKFTSTYSYHSTPFVFLVRRGAIFGPIKQLINPLNKSTWIFLLFHYILMMILIQVVENRRNRAIRNFIFGPRNKNPMRNAFSAYLGNPIPTQILPKRNFARVILMSWLLLTFEIRNAYQGKLFDSLRLSKRLPVPRKIRDLIQMDYTLLSPLYSDFYPSNKTVLMRNATKRIELLQFSDKHLTTTSLLDYMVHYNAKNYNTSSLTFVEEKIFSHQCVIFLSKHSILRESVDRKLKLFLYSGITSHIAKKHVHSRFKKLEKSPQDISQISNTNLLGLYTLYGMLCEIALFSFILELLTKKSKRLKKVMDWLN